MLNAEPTPQQVKAIVSMPEPIPPPQQVTDEEIEAYLELPTIIENTSENVTSNGANTNKEELPELVLTMEAGIIKNYRAVHHLITVRKEYCII